MATARTLERVEAASAAALRAWLEARHAQAESVWLVTWKKAAGARYVSTGEVLDELLCFGWIDGVRRRLDETRTMQLIAPRRRQAWALSYRERAARLIAEGRMRAPGLAAIERSMALGLWEATPDVDALIAPDDLVLALAERPGAAETFDAFPPSYRRNVLRWIAGARTPPTRAKRIAALVERTAAGDRVPQM